MTREEIKLALTDPTKCNEQSLKDATDAVVAMDDTEVLDIMLNILKIYCELEDLALSNFMNNNEKLQNRVKSLVSSLDPEYLKDIHGGRICLKPF